MTPFRSGKTMTVLGSIPVVIFGLALGARPGAQVVAPSPRPDVKAPTDPLLALNDASRAAYRRAKEAALARTGPVILVEGDHLVLRHGGRRTETRFTPDVFHDLKAVSHIPLALDVMLTPVPDGEPLGDALLDEFRRYRGLVVGVQERVGTLGLPPDQVRRQGEIISRSLEFIDTLTRTRTCGRAARTAFARRMAPLIMANVSDAARAELDALHRLVRHWKEEMPAGDWDRLTVIVMGRPLPRKDSLAVQFFSRLLGEPGEGRRVVFAESLFDEANALDLLATRLVDTQIGLDFFDDPTRMHRDLLGDAAREYLDHLLGRPGGAARDQGRSAAGGEATRDPG
jgi:hypothetical protein